MPNLYVQNVKPVNIHIGSQQIRYVRVGNTVVWEYTTTTTTTTTPPPITFDIASSCSGGSGVITISNFANGSGQYQASSTYHTSIANAFSGSFVDATSPKVYTGVPNGTWYIVVRDKNNTSLGTYHSTTVSCTTTTTTTTPAGAGYYDCGYGCQYYTYNPGCTVCQAEIIINNYSTDVQITDVFIESTSVFTGLLEPGQSTTVYTNITGYVNIVVVFGYSNTLQNILIEDSISQIQCMNVSDGSPFSGGIYLDTTTTAYINASNGSCE